jgi:hypothetical protein
MLVRFTRLAGPRYRVDVVRELDPPACMHVAPGFDEFLPHDLVHFLVEREFRVRLGIFGQLAAGGDAGTFWCAPADRNARLAQRAHRLLVAGRGDLGRSERLSAACFAAWEKTRGRRRAGAAWPAQMLHDTIAVAPADIARVVEVFDEVAEKWHALETGQSLVFEWPPALTLRRTARLRSA